MLSSIMMTGARLQQPIQATDSTVNFPSSVVAPSAHAEFVAERVRDGACALNVIHAVP